VFGAFSPWRAAGCALCGPGCHDPFALVMWHERVWWAWMLWSAPRFRPRWLVSLCGGHRLSLRFPRIGGRPRPEELCVPPPPGRPPPPPHKIPGTPRARHSETHQLIRCIGRGPMAKSGWPGGYRTVSRHQIGVRNHFKDKIPSSAEYRGILQLTPLSARSGLVQIWISAVTGAGYFFYVWSGRFFFCFAENGWTPYRSRDRCSGNLGPELERRGCCGG